MLTICLTDSSPPSIMTSLVRLSVPRALLFFISFGVFLTSDIMIGGISDVWLVFFHKECLSCSVKLYSSLQKRAHIFSISSLSVCTSFSLFFISYVFFSDPPLYLFWTSTALKYSFNMICSFPL